MFGAKRRLARELAHEVLRPLHKETTDLTATSQQNFEAEIMRQVKAGNADKVYESQRGWRKAEE